MENEKSKACFIVFIIVLIALVIGGFITMRYLLESFENDNQSGKETVTEITDKRIDKTKDYIYFTDEEVVIEEYAITFKTLNINLSSGAEIESRLNAEMESLKNTITYTKDLTEKLPEENYETEEGINTVSYLTYEIIEFGDYMSLMIKRYDYNAATFVTGTKVEVINFSKTTGNIVPETTILESNNESIDSIKGLIKTKLTNLNLEEDINDVTKTLEGFTNYGIYYNKIGSLEITYLVESTKQDYYDKLVIN